MHKHSDADMVRDALRYRWLRENGFTLGLFAAGGYLRYEAIRPPNQEEFDKVDATIDAALQSVPKTEWKV